jgi:hypothetical protein
VKPEIKVRSQPALPYDIEEAFRKAQTAEVWLLVQKVKKAETKALTSMEVEGENGEEMVANINNNNNSNKSGNESNSHRGFRSGFRGGFRCGFRGGSRGGRGGNRQFNNNMNTNINSQTYEVETTSNNNSNNTSGNKNYERQRYINYQCFGCNKAGHRFSQCWSIDDAKRNEIQKNLSSYINKDKKML